MFNRLALIGCGLMGGSLALAMQRARLVRHVVAYSPSESTLQAALQAGVIHEAAHSPADATAHADLVVVAVPVAATETVLRSVLSFTGSNLSSAAAGPENISIRLMAMAQNKVNVRAVRVVGWFITRSSGRIDGSS